MKSKEEKLSELLQPKDYISKIKLFCRPCQNIFGGLENNSYICKKLKDNE